MARQRFLIVWLGFALLYVAIAAVKPEGGLRHGSWPQTNQHLLQVRAWRGDDILVPATAKRGAERIDVTPRLDVTPYFRHWVLEDPSERVLLANLACAVPAADGGLAPVRYVASDSVAARLQMERLVCHVGSPLGPAFLLLPLHVLLGGALRCQWLGALLGGLAVAIMDMLLAWWLDAVRGAETARPGERRWLLALVGCGTLWIWLAPQGEVWMFAQTVATCGLTAALALTWRRSWLWAGLAMAVAITSRPTVVMAAPLLLAIAVERWSADRLGTADRRRRAWTLVLLFPLLLVAAHGALNWARFASPLDFGYRYMLTPPELRERFEEYGQFNIFYLGRNVRYLLWQPPVAAVDDETGEVRFPYLVSDRQGMGLVFVTPALLAVLLTIRRSWRSPGLVAAAWLSLALVTAPALLYFNTGWVQWGGRYLLDGWPLWLLVAALGLYRMPSVLARALIALSVASNLWAALLLAGGWWP